jgi:hypothetical protein
MLVIKINTKNVLVRCLMKIVLSLPDKKKNADAYLYNFCVNENTAHTQHTEIKNKAVYA